MVLTEGQLHMTILEKKKCIQMILNYEALLSNGYLFFEFTITHRNMQFLNQASLRKMKELEKKLPEKFTLRLISFVSGNLLKNLDLIIILTLNLK